VVRTDKFSRETIVNYRKYILYKITPYTILIGKSRNRNTNDSNRFAATSAIAIMRTFASSGQMNRLLYHPEDPFAVARETDSK